MIASCSKLRGQTFIFSPPSPVFVPYFDVFRKKLGA